MELPFFSKKKNTDKDSYYFGLFLKEEEGVVLLLKEENGQIKIENSEKFTYSDGWENLTEDVDQALYKLETLSKRNPDKIILFIYSHFIDESIHEIKKPYFQKIKILLKDLDLKPLGYIEAYEAVVDYLRKKEESPLTAILVELDKSILTVFVYKGGHKTYVKSISRTDSLVEDFLHIFEEQKGKILLPSRIILYNSKDLDDESTKILVHHWSEDLFVQLPRTEIIKEDELLKGLVEVFSGQIKNQCKEVKAEMPEKEVMGFLIGADVGKEEEKKNKLVLPKISFNFFNIIISKMPKIKPSSTLLFLVGFFLVALGIFFVEFFFHRADLIIYFPSQLINKDIEFSDVISSDNSVIKIATKSVDLKGSIPTTGKQMIGDKAKGEVNIFNFSDKEVNFGKGTILETDGLKFVLDSDVKTASASEILIDSSPAKKPGEGTGKITADQIGPESNIVKGKRFQIENLSFSIYFAINNIAFSGGSKKEVKTVAKKDMDDLLNKVIKKVKSETQNDMSDQKGQKIISDLTETALQNKQFSKEIGEETQELNLSAKAIVTKYVYTDSEIRDYLLSKLKDEVQEGYQLESKDLQYKFKKAAKKDDTIELTININAKAVKKIANKELLKKMSMKNKKDIDILLKKTYQAQGYKLDIRHPVSFFQNWMPFFTENIHIEISSL